MMIANLLDVIFGCTMTARALDPDLALVHVHALAPALPCLTVPVHALAPQIVIDLVQRLQNGMCKRIFNSHKIDMD